MNRSTLVGRLVDDLQTTELPNGSTVTEGRIAVDGMGSRQPDNSYSAGFINIRSFGPGGQAAAQHLHKGDPVAVDGALRHDQWQTADGQRRQSYSIIGDLQFLPRPASNSGRERQLDQPASQELAHDHAPVTPAATAAAQTSPAPAAGIPAAAVNAAAQLADHSIGAGLGGR